MVNNPLHVEKTMSMLFIELGLATPFLLFMIVGSSCDDCCLFLDHNRKSNFCHPL
jgi:hypothetical protein